VAGDRLWCNSFPAYHSVTWKRVFELLLMCLNALCQIVAQNAHRPHSSALFLISLTIRKLSSVTYDCQHQLSELSIHMYQRPLGLLCLVQLLPGSGLTNCHSSVCIQKMTEMRYRLDANGKNKKPIKLWPYWSLLGNRMRNSKQFWTEDGRLMVE